MSWLRVKPKMKTPLVIAARTVPIRRPWPRPSAPPPGHPVRTLSTASHHFPANGQGITDVVENVPTAIDERGSNHPVFGPPSPRPSPPGEGAPCAAFQQGEDRGLSFRFWSERPRSGRGQWRDGMFRERPLAIPSPGGEGQGEGGRSFH